jgi:hypothetical protein
MTDKANISRRIDLLMAKANHKDTEPAEANACREKAKELRARYDIKEVSGPLLPNSYNLVRMPNWTPPNWVTRETDFDDLIPDEWQYDDPNGDW